MGGCHRTAPGAADATAGKDEPKVVVDVMVAVARRGAIGSEVAASGVVQPLPDREATVNAPVAGKVRTIYVRQGDRVAKGQAVIQLDDAKLKDVVRQAQAAVAAARSQVAQAALDVLSQEQAHRATVQAAETGLRTAELNLSKIAAGARPQEIAQAEAAVYQAEAALGNARAARDRTDALLQHGIVAKKDAQDAATQYRIAQSQLESAREALSLVRAGARPQEVADARVQVRQAQNALQTAKAGSVDTRAKEEAMHALRDGEKGAEAALSAAHADLALATLRAPVSGEVILRAVTPGATVDPATALVTIADLSEVEFAAQVQPQDLPRVSMGQSATLTFPAYPGRSWPGRVTAVGQQADPKTGTVPARIRVSNADRRLKDDMYGSARIQSIQRQSLLVPSSAVLTDEDGPYVMAVDAKGAAQRKGVKTGLVEGGKTEILSGLSDGTRVIVSGNYGLEAGTQVRVSP